MSAPLATPSNTSLPKRGASQTDAAIFDCFDRLRFPLIVLVIYIHNASFTVTFADGRAGSNGERFQTFLVDFLSNGVARVAVPLFFFMSGYLFFFGQRLTRPVYFKKINSRVYTLFIPFLFWNCFNLLFYFIAQSNPLTAAWLGGTIPTLRQLSIWQLLDLLVGFTSLSIAYQFWFIRDLMILIVLTPIIWATARFVGPIVAIVLIVLWVTLAYPLRMPGIEPTLFFFLGAYCAIASIPILAVRRNWRSFASLAAALFVVAAWHFSPWVTRLAACTAIALGLAAALGWSTGLPERSAKLLSRLSRASFFTFAVHEPLLQIFRKLLYRILPMNPTIAVAIYLFLPLAIAALSLIMFEVARRATPQLLALSTGKRS